MEEGNSYKPGDSVSWDVSSLTTTKRPGFNSKLKKWGLAALLAAGIATAGIITYQRSAVVSDDCVSVEQRLDKQESLETLVKGIPLSIKQRPSVYDELGYDEKVSYTFPALRLQEKNTIAGRLQRTLRWEEVYRTVEEKYGILKNLIGGIIMQESYGDPTLPNSSGDGGIGLAHTQGTTAVEYGLKTVAKSITDSDREHGKAIQNLLETYKYDLGKMSAEDERLHLVKIVDATARILVNGYRKGGSDDWDDALRFFRGWGASKEQIAHYQDKVHEFQDALNNTSTREEAEFWFNEHNTITFDKYVCMHQEMARVNYGLDVYAQKNLADEKEILPNIIVADNLFDASNASAIPYVVQKGDNLGVIAQKFNVWDYNQGNVYQLIGTDNFSTKDGKAMNSNLQIGQTVYISAKKN